MPGPSNDDSFGDDDDETAGGLVAKGQPGDNAAPLSITEISNLLKRTVDHRAFVPVSYTHLTLPTILLV